MYFTFLRLKTSSFKFLLTIFRVPSSFFVCNFLGLSLVYSLLLNRTQRWKTLPNTWTTLTIPLDHKSNVSSFSVVTTVLYQSTQYWVLRWSGSLNIWSNLNTLVLIFQISTYSSRLSYNQTILPPTSGCYLLYSPKTVFNSAFPNTSTKPVNLFGFQFLFYHIRWPTFHFLFLSHNVFLLISIFQ